MEENREEAAGRPVTVRLNRRQVAQLKGLRDLNARYPLGAIDQSDAMILRMCLGYTYKCLCETEPGKIGGTHEETTGARDDA